MDEQKENDRNGGEVQIIEPLIESQMSPLFAENAGLSEVHSFNMNDATESMLYVNAVGGESEPIKYMVGKEIPVAFYYVKAIDFAAGKDDPRFAEGEVIKGIRCVLVTPTGEQFHTTSPTAIKTIAALHKTALGKKRFNPPVTLRVGMVKTRGGWDSNTLTVVPTKATDKPA